MRPDPAKPAHAAPTSLKFQRGVRVRARAEFTQVFEHGKRLGHPLLGLHWLADDKPARLGLAVSRKVDPHAVGRNRIKRVLRDAFRHQRARMAGGAYVVVARTAAGKADNRALREAFASLLQRSGALPPPTLTGTMPAPSLTD